MQAMKPPSRRPETGLLSVMFLPGLQSFGSDLVRRVGEADGKQRRSAFVPSDAGKELHASADSSLGLYQPGVQLEVDR